MLHGLAADVFGDYVEVSIDPGVYSEAAIFKAAYWFTDRYFLFLDKAAGARLVVEIRSKTPVENDELKRVASEFCNSLIDFRVREIVNKETAPIREALVTRAFLEGVPRHGLKGALSNEQYLTKP
jgi:His-Xaa-Ser system protein HxsD